MFTIPNNNSYSASRRSLITPISTLALIISMQMSAASAQVSNATPKAYQYSKSTLAELLPKLAQQEGLEIVVDPKVSDLANYPTPAVQGPMTLGELLNQISSGTGLVISVNNGKISVAPKNVGPETAESRTPVETGELTVEGERIGRTLRETPANVVVITGDQIERSPTRNTKEVLRAIPNVLADQETKMPSIRGLDGSGAAQGGVAFSAGARPRTNVVVDGVVTPLVNGPVATNGSQWDVEQVEVARGPQSTNQGRNSIAGAIRIKTRDPVYENQAAIRTSYRNEQNLYGVDTMANMVVVPNEVALRVVVEGAEGKNFVTVSDPVASDDDIERVERERYGRIRGKLLIEPDAIDDLKVVLSIDHQKQQHTFDPGAVNGDPFQYHIFDYSTAASYEQNNQTSWVMNSTYQWNKDLVWDSHMSFHDNDLRIPRVPRDLNFDFNHDTRSFSADNVLKIGEWNWFKKSAIGFSYFNQRDDGRNPVNNFNLTSSQHIHNAALFGETELSFFDPVTFIVGGRFDYEDQRRELFSNVFGRISSLTVNREDNVFLPKLGVRIDVTKDIAAGYTYQEGWRPGGASIDFFFTGAISAFEPEYLQQHEVYTRAEWFDGKLAVNGSIFHWTLEDGQFTGVVSDLIISNAPQAKALGAELSASASPLPGLTFNGGVGLLDASFKQLPANTPANTSANLLNEPLPDAPHLTGNLGATYYGPLGLDANMSARYVGELFPSRVRVRLGDYIVTDANLGWEHQFQNGQSVRLQAFIHNLFDEQYHTNMISDANRNGFADTGDTAAVGRPRTIGFNATFKF